MSPLKQVSVLIPLREDEEVGDGQLHPPERWKLFKDGLMTRFGGFTMDSSPKRGEWADPKTGKQVTDESYLYFVAVPENEIEDLKAYLAEMRKLFKQKCLYVESGGTVEFI